MAKLVSEVIPAFNRGHLQGDILDCARAQKYQYLKYIIVDDGFRDYTGELMNFYWKRDRRIRFYRRPIVLMKSANSCRNFVFSEIAGDYITGSRRAGAFLERKFKILLTYSLSLDAGICYPSKRGLNYEQKQSSVYFHLNSLTLHSD